MKRCSIFAAAALQASIAAAASAEPRETVQPIQLGTEAVRFDRGDYIVDLVGHRAALQIRPMPADHGAISFVIAVLNMGTLPINVDTTDLHVEGALEPARLLSRSEMVQKVEHRAGWAKFFTRLGGALEASGYASERNQTTVSVSTPYGSAWASASSPCGSCQLAALAVETRTAQRVSAIQDSLDAARNTLGKQMLQLTTLYPGQSYAGRIFIAKFKHQSMSPMRLVMMIGDEPFTFGFRFAPENAPHPAYQLALTPTIFTTPLPTIANANRVDTAPAAQSAVSRMPRSVQFMNASAGSAAPATHQTVAKHVDIAAGSDWRRYYASLIENGVPRAQAKAMADGEFTPPN